MNKRSISDWQLTKEKLTDRGKYLLETGLWSDCKFLVGEAPQQNELMAHKIFLTMASPVFEVMFHGEMAERSIITVNDIQPEAFKSMLMYVYTDEVNIQSFDQACELCYVAKKYMMPHLVQICTEYLWKDLNEENACRAYEFGRLFEESVLMDKSMVIIRSETKRILEDNKFAEVELPTLLAILDQDNLSIDSEVHLFNAVYNWAIAECQRKDIPVDDIDALRVIALPALYKIRFLTMKPQEFSSGPAKCQLLKQSEAFAILMNLCSSDVENYPMPDGFSTSKLPRHVKVTDMIFLPNYCERKMVHQMFVSNHGGSESSVLFKVDRDVFILGMQVYAQIILQQLQSTTKYLPFSLVDVTSRHSQGLLNNTFHGHGDERTAESMLGINAKYQESLRAQLLAEDNTCITFCHFQKTVQFNQLLDIYFNVPYKVLKNKTYKMNIILHKSGLYPKGKYVNKSSNNSPVTFSFSNDFSPLGEEYSHIHSVIFHP